MHATNIYWWSIICQAEDLMTKKEKKIPLLQELIVKLEKQTILDKKW